MERIISIFIGFLVALGFMLIPVNPGFSNPFIQLIRFIFRFVGFTFVIVFGITLIKNGIKNLK